MTSCLCTVQVLRLEIGQTIINLNGFSTPGCTAVQIALSQQSTCGLFSAEVPRIYLSACITKQCTVGFSEFIVGPVMISV